jgi:hypothetical protein
MVDFDLAGCNDNARDAWSFISDKPAARAGVSLKPKNERHFY